MNRLAKISSILTIPIFLGFIFLIAGMQRLGEIFLFWVTPFILIPAVSFIIVGIITGNKFLFGGKKSKNIYKNNSADDEEIKEYKEIADINSSRGRDSHWKHGKYLMRHTQENYKYATNKEKILSWILLIFLDINLLLAVVFMNLNVTLGYLICFCIFASTVIIAIITKRIKEQRSINPKIDAIFEI